MACKVYPVGMNITADTLVTGGTGFVGRWLVASLTRQGQRVVVVARGGGARGEELAAFVDSHGGDSAKLVVVDGDLTASGLGISEAIDGVRDVYHLAAAFSFGMAAKRARAINVGGTLHAAEWALAQPSLRRFVYLGGYRATVLPDWLAAASYPLPARVAKRLYRHKGAYEASKLEAHFAIGDFAARHGLPMTRVHPSSVIGSSATGETSQVTGLGETVERLWRGHLPALAGSKRTFVPVVSVDYLADFLASVPQREETVGRDLCVLDQNTPRLPELVATVADHLGVKAPERLIPIGVVERLPSALTGLDREAVGFLTEDEYDTGEADAHGRAAGLQLPDVHETVRRWATHLVATQFGRSSMAEVEQPGEFVSVEGSRTWTAGDPRTTDWIFLHGLPWDSDSGIPLAEALAEQSGEVVARPDLPGMGRSSRAAVTDDEWLASFLADRQKPVRIIAHSLSTGIAVRYARKHPDRVGELVLVSPFFVQARAPWYLRFAPLTKYLLRAGDAEAMQRRLIGASASLHPAVRSAHDNLTRANVAGRVASALATASHRAEREQLRRELAACEVPVSIIHGERDRLVVAPPPGVSVSVVGSGHNPHIENPAAVAAVIARGQGSHQRILAAG